MFETPSEDYHRADRYAGASRRSDDADKLATGLKRLVSALHMCGQAVPKAAQGGDQLATVADWLEHEAYRG
jgi:hypothetical protein